MYKKNVFILIMFFGFLVKGQVPVDEISADTQIFKKEISRLVINTNVLLTGELLLYKIYNLTTSKTKSPLSKIIYISLRSEKDSVVFNHKLKLGNGSAEGSFFIPALLRTGVYRLVSYTNFSRNNLQDAFEQKNIYVINPYVKTGVDTQKEINSSEVVELREASVEISDYWEQVTENGISLKMNKPLYKTREKVTLKIENLQGIEGFGDYVLSVRKTDDVQITDLPLQAETSGVQNGKIFYLPEFRGELISGKITPVEGNLQVENKVVALTIPGNDYIFKNAKTNKNGRFFFSIDEVYQKGNSIVQINELDKEKYKIFIDKKEFNSAEKITGVAFKLNPSIEDWLLKRSIQLQIENAYFNLKKNVILEEKSRGLFYGTMGTEYVLDDYTRFLTVKETFVEVVTLAAIRQEDDINRIVVFNAYDPDGTALFNSLDPLLLMDGMLIQDTNEILNYNAKDTKSIRVIPTAYRYGPKLYSGIVIIKTIKGNFKPLLKGDYMKEFELERPLPAKQYYSPDYSNKSLKRIPDYRIQLFWEPNIKLAEKELAKSFYASDITGTFEVVLEGYTKGGNHIMKKRYFTIE